MSPAEERELQQVVALLHQLPDPEPPADLTGRILTAVAAREARTRGLRRFAPYAGTALAAGLATLAVLTASPRLSPSWQSPTTEPALTASVARPVATATTSQARAEALRRPALSAVAPVVVAGRPASFFAPRIRDFSFDSDGRPMTLDTARIVERRLDHEINHLLLDPPSFFERLSRRRDRDLLVSRIAARAAARGDVVEVALQLRQRAPGHPEAARMTEALLRSAAAQGSPAR